MEPSADAGGSVFLWYLELTEPELFCHGFGGEGML